MLEHIPAFHISLQIERILGGTDNLMYCGVGHVTTTKEHSNVDVCTVNSPFAWTRRVE